MQTFFLETVTKIENKLKCNTNSTNSASISSINLALDKFCLVGLKCLTK